MRYDIASYFFKCSTVLFEDYYLYPGNVRDVIKLQEEHGTKIQFTLNNEWLK
jgi:hypothetical protein